MRPSILCALAMTTLLGAADETPWTMPAEERTAIQRVVQRAIDAGLPDARGGTLHRGPLFRKVDGKQERLCRSDAFSLRFTDGRWLVDFRQLEQIDDRQPIDAGAATPFLPEAFTAAIAAQRDQQRTFWLEDIGPHLTTGDRRRLLACADMDCVWQGDLIGTDRPATVTAHLIRLGYPRAEYLVPMLALHRAARQEMGWPAGSEPFLLLREGLAWPRSWWQPPDPWTPLPPATALRRALVEESITRTSPIPELQGSHPREAWPAILAFAETMTDPDETVMRARIAGLRAALALPDDIPARADVVRRLMVQEPPVTFNIPADAQVTFTPFSDALLPKEAGDHRPDDLMERLRRQRITSDDIPGLMAALDDARPCRWLDVNLPAKPWPRTIGDQALRNLGALLHVDPRRMVGRDTGARWDDQERRATANALRQWWQARQQLTPDDLCLECLPAMTIDGVAATLAQIPEPRRSDILVRLARDWREPPADPADNKAMGDVLHLGKDHAGFCATVDAWPDAGPYRLLLAHWHLSRHHPQRMQTWMDAIMDGSGDMRDMSTALIIAGRFPALGLAKAFQACLKRPTDQPQTVALLSLLCAPSGGPDSLYFDQPQTFGELLKDLAPQDPQPLRVALWAQCVWDARPAPAILTQALRDSWEHLRTERRRNPSLKMFPSLPDRDLPGDLRIADHAIAALTISSHGYLGRRFSEDERLEMDLDTFDFTAPTIDRDRQLTHLRHLLIGCLPSWLQDRGLTADIPDRPGINDF